MKFFLPIFSKLFMHFEGGGGEAALMSSGDMVFSEEIPKVLRVILSFNTV